MHLNIQGDPDNVFTIGKSEKNKGYKIDLMGGTFLDFVLVNNIITILFTAAIFQ